MEQVAAGVPTGYDLGAVNLGSANFPIKIRQIRVQKVTT